MAGALLLQLACMVQCHIGGQSDVLAPVPAESDKRELAEEGEAGRGYRRQPAKLLAGNQSGHWDSGSVSPSGGSRMPLIMAGRQQQSRLQAGSRGEDEEPEPWQSQYNRCLGQQAAVLAEPGSEHCSS